MFSGQQLTGQQYFTAAEFWRRIGHIISDAIYVTVALMWLAPDKRIERRLDRHEV